MEIEPGTLARITELYHAGLCLQAYRLAEAHGPLRCWRQTEARLIGGRVVSNMGSSRLGVAMHWLAYRDDPTHPDARYYFGRLLIRTRGPLAAWEFLRSVGADLPGAGTRQQADWLGTHAAVLCVYRDAPAADEYMRRAERLAPDRPWICVERAHYHETFDEYDAAIEAARRALALRPMFRPAVQSLGHLLVLSGADDEALALLSEAADRLESVPVLLQLASLQGELGQFAEARQTYDRVVELAAISDRHFRKWLTAARSNAAYKCGDLDAAVALARESGEAWFKEFLADPGHIGDGRRRVCLPAGFVRQHHSTCAPATLATLSRFWGRPAEHLEIAERICFDGTPAHSERHWAETHGWTVREFTVTWEATVALIDRGVPFTLTTIEPTNGHLQACIGYDSRRRTLLLRDPFVRNLGELTVDTGLAAYRSTGPRGMAMVPAEQAALLEDIELPDTALYDGFYQVQRALEAHDRAAAAAAVQGMIVADANHRLTLDARRTLAGYDGDVPEMLAINDAQLAQFPDDVRLRLSRIALLRDLSRQDQRLEELRALCRSTQSDPLFHLRYAQELRDDARHAREAERRLRWVLRRRPTHASALRALADILWDDPTRREQSLQLYRLASAIDDKDDYLAMTWFTAARMLGRPGEVLDVLRWRFRRHGRRAAQPAMTLFRALEEMDATIEGFEVLDEALRERRDDGALMLFAAEARGRYGQMDLASELLERARGRTHESAWLRSAAQLASYRGALAESLALWQRLANLEPLAVDAHRNIVMRLSETDGLTAARAHLRQITERFPHHVELHRLRINWLRDEPAEAEAVIRHLIDNQPSDAWAVRELAYVQVNTGRLDEASESAAQAEVLDPDSAATAALRATLHERRGELEAARAAYRQALSRTVDFEAAMHGLWDLCDTGADRRDAATFIVEQLKQQVMQGDGLLLFRRLAAGTLSRDELMTTMREAFEARPDLWHAWSAWMHQLADAGRLEEATAVAEEAARERFPLLPGAWLDLALICRLRNDSAGRLAALEQAVQINPRWGWAIRVLADAQRDVGRYDAARATLERGLALCPTDAAIHVDLAVLLWMSDRAAALQRLQHALRLEEQDERIWRLLEEWSAAQKQPELAMEAARELVDRRGGEAASWLVLARVLPADALDERLAALDKAIALSPRRWEAYDMRAVLLTEAGRFEEALQACQPGDGQVPPVILRGRAAWVHAQRHELRRAIALMGDVLRDDPGYGWGWRTLAGWHQAMGEHDKQAQAMQTLAELVPHDAVVQCDLAGARLRCDDRSGAKAALRRAMELDPSYGRAGMTLFDLLVEDKQHAELGNIIDSLTLHVDGPWTTARRIHYACINADLPRARQEFAALCAQEIDGDWPVESSMQVLLDHMPWQKVAAIVHEVLAGSPTCHDGLASFWISRIGRTSPAERRRTLKEAAARGGPVYQRARRMNLLVLADLGKRIPALWVLWRQRQALREAAIDWGTAGNALLTLGLHRRCIKWMRDWRERDGVEPWMLLNLAVALRNRGRSEEAAAVGRAALQLRADDSSDCHALWVAASLAADGDADGAGRLLADVPANGLDAYYTCLYRLVAATVAMGSAAEADRSAAFATAKAEIAAAVRQYPACSHASALWRAMLALTRRIVLDRGGAAARLWRWGFIMGRWQIW